MPRKNVKQAKHLKEAENMKQKACEATKHVSKARETTEHLKRNQ